ncbi:ABC transporter permease subunit [Microbacterium sp. SORGH_AS_0888]|uniref:ABC transporter permease subunit n=1 Tax=Microbacterium sp. SORGH_AS_0888 TaxID=3041791 RepID=UPI00278A69F0|nr:ABC transporter permease subunit [Microbacterium sp. SORGH_AS_0888]MDQ1128745.1 ABC-2 type transport system permease protein [Microbacterium sp. SORGH_AS_0888]
MSAVTATEVQTRTSPHRLSFGRVIRSETIKILTLRSTWWSLGIVAVLSIGFSLMIAAQLAGSYRNAEEAGVSFDYAPVMAIVAPTQFTMLLAGALGAIAITGEYSTGMIRSTLTAEPRRGVVLAAKAIVVAVVLAVSSLVVFGLSALVTAPSLQSTPIDWSTPEQSILPIGYGALSMAVFAIIGLSFGFVVRNGAGAVAATVGILFVLPIVTNIFGAVDPAWAWVGDLARLLPMNAAQALMSPGTTPGGLDDPTALLALGGWCAAGLLGSWAVLRSRDA